MINGDIYITQRTAIEFQIRKSCSPRRLYPSMYLRKNKKKCNLNCSFRIQVEVKVSSKEDLRELEMSETRIVLLYSTNIEGSNIMKWASEAGLTGRSYVWIATQSVIGESVEGSPELPAGMLGE